MERVSGCRSEALCYDGVNMDWQKVAMQDRGGGTTEEHATAERGSMAMERRQSRPTTEQQQALRCPRCDSANTKFCYYNNYSQSQPRHFCKNCRRYWTRGGALRNVPVGGGCRKNKRPKLRSTPEQQQQQNSHDNPPLHKPLISCPPPISLIPSPPAFFNLPSLAHQIDLSSAFPASTTQPFTSAIFNHLPSLPQPTLASLSNHLPHLGLRRSVLGLDNFNGVHTSFLDTASLQLAPPSAPPNGFHDFNGIDPIAKLALGLEDSQMMDGHVLGAYQGEEEQPLENLRPLCVPIKAEEESPSGTDWHGGQQAGAFYGQTSESSFWNNGATWPNLHARSTSASPLF